MRGLLGWLSREETHAVIEQVAPRQDEAFFEAKQALLDKHRIATVDHNGRRLNERRWRYIRDYIEGAL